MFATLQKAQQDHRNRHTTYVGRPQSPALSTKRISRAVLRAALSICTFELRLYAYLVQRRLSIALLCCLAEICTVDLQGQHSSETDLRLAVAPECSIDMVSVLPGTSNEQTATFRYQLRTTAAGDGEIRIRLTPSGDKTYPTGSEVVYRTTLVGPGSPSSGAIALATALDSGIVIARFDSDAHSSRGARGSVQLALDKPVVALDLPRPLFSITCR